MKLLILMIAFFANQSSWHLVKTKDDIKVYHKQNGKATDVKIETTLNCSLSAATEALLDVSSFDQWIYKLKSSKTIKKVSDRHIVYYNQIDMPWPTTDRDLVASVKIRQDPKTKIVTSEDFLEPNGLDENPDYIRIKDFYAKWTFEPMTNGLKATYIFHSHPSGNIPVAIQKLFLDEGPINSVKGLKKIVKLPKYQHGSSHGIVD